jgi:hypothetical protein
MHACPQEIVEGNRDGCGKVPCYAGSRDVFEHPAKRSEKELLLLPAYIGVKLVKEVKKRFCEH